MKSFNYKKRNFFSGPHLLGTLLVFAGLFALLSPVLLKSGSSLTKILLVGTGALMIGVLILFSYNGTTIDFTQKRFKKYLSIVGFKSGDWLALPEISNVKVISSNYLTNNIPNGVSPTLSWEVTDYKIFLYSSAAKPLLSFEYSNRDKAVKNARQLAEVLGADLLLNIPENKGEHE